MYKSILNERETEHAIKLIKDTFQVQLSSALQLRRVTAPLFVKSGLGINDDLNGIENPVSFTIKSSGEKAEIVHSLAKWKRIKLGEMKELPGYGLYTDMNAIRPDEDLDYLHSLYVDQWDWEKVINKDDRNIDYLFDAVCMIYGAIKNTEYIICERYPNINHFLPNDIMFIHSEDLLKMYPNLSAKERENAICKKYGSVFIIGIGGKLANGERHDGRAADYDDWSTPDNYEYNQPEPPDPNGPVYRGLNGDILVWCDWLNKAVELSSMGIRVDTDSLTVQMGEFNKEWFDYHKKILNNELPLTIGGGIGQSRLCMVLLHKMHIGEIQASIWPDEEIEKCAKQNIKLL